jgi:methylated-DNA-[protein]-cysteine S-methyltransferase
VLTTFTVIPSPIGQLLLTSDGASLTGLYVGTSVLREDWRRDDDGFAAARTQLAAYFAGRLTAFDLPLAPAGTAFQQRVWSALRAVPYGSVVTYGQLADRLGNPTAARAVGLANARNPISIVVPCHRVIGANGKLVGYGGGLDRKRQLLALEGCALAV